MKQHGSKAHYSFHCSIVEAMRGVVKKYDCARRQPDVLGELGIDKVM